MATPMEAWVEEAARLTKPDKVVFCDGSEAENQGILQEMLRQGDSFALNEKTYPNCYLHRSNPSDVARTEHLTFICSPEKDDVGPTNNWMDPGGAKFKVGRLLDGAMRGRTMYVVPYIMGPAGSPISKVGVEVTDSPYVVASMRIMSRMGKVATDQLGSSADFVPGLHSLGDLDPLRRYIVHFPEERLIWSVGSGYGGNALLGKKCFALRIASYMARQQGWMAEHMLILGLESPGGKVTYMAAAFPSACGKTNLAMMVSTLESQGYKVWTVGDDIAWMQIGPDGYLRAINPEAGFFGVAPGTGMKTNPNVMDALTHNTIFTNTGMTPSGEPWWEGIGSEPPAGLITWRGEKWDPSKGVAAQPNSRYTVPANQSPKHFAEVGSAGRRAHFRFHIWRQAGAAGAASLSVIRLAAWRIRRRHDGVRDDRGGHRRCGNHAPGSHGDVALLRLQHGGLFPALAGHGQKNPPSPEDFPCELVP